MRSGLASELHFCIAMEDTPISPEVLRAFLFGGTVRAPRLIASLKQLGVLHLLVFSGSHVIFWQRTLRKILYECFDGRRGSIVEWVIWFGLVTLHTCIEQGWAARRALVFQWILFMGHIPFRRSPTALLMTQSVVLVIMFLCEPEAFRYMGTWMSIVGTLMLSWGSRWLGHEPGMGVVLGVIVTISQWHLARMFGVTFSLLAGVVLGIFYGFLLDRGFSIIVLMYFAAMVNPGLAKLMDRFLLSLCRFHERILQWDFLFFF